MSEDRYQHQSWYVKAWRQLRYKPKWIAMYFWCLIRRRGADWDMANDDLWSLCMGMCDCDMRHLYSADEVEADLFGDTLSPQEPQ